MQSQPPLSGQKAFVTRPLPFKERYTKGFISLDIFDQVDCAPTFCIKGEGGGADVSNSAYIGEAP